MFFLFYNAEDAPDYGPNLSRLANVLNIAREFAPDISINTLSTFFIIIQYNKELAGMNKTLPQLSDELGIPYPRMMRHLDVLSDGTPSAPGHKLLDKIIDPRWKRNRKYAPSVRGDLMLRRMLEKLS